MANILVVDDDRNIRRMLATALEGAGHNVAEAAGAAQALSRLAAAPAVELVLTDVRMEKTDGIALLEQIKQLRPALPVIIMTAFGSIPAAVEAMRLGAYRLRAQAFQRAADPPNGGARAGNTVAPTGKPRVEIPA